MNNITSTDDSASDVSVLDEIIDSFGDPGEFIDEFDLENICDELETLNLLEIFDLAKVAIELGKPQILHIILEEYEFSPKQVQQLNNAIDKIEDEYSEDIIDQFVKQITKYNSTKWHLKKKR